MNALIYQAKTFAIANYTTQAIIVTYTRQHFIQSNKFIMEIWQIWLQSKILPTVVTTYNSDNTCLRNTIADEKYIWTLSQHNSLFISIHIAIQNFNL